MIKPFISESELIDLDERYKETQLLANKKLGAKLDTNLTNNTLALMEVINIERLEKSSKILNRLTSWLIALTLLLTILTAILVWRTF